MDSQLRLHQSSTLTITPQLQQAIHLLQLSYYELEAFLQNHLDQNPFLTTTEEHTEEEPLASMPDDSLMFSCSPESGSHSSSRMLDLQDLPDPLIPAPLTLREHLMQQVGSQMTTYKERLIGTYLVQFIQPTGYFEGNQQDIAQQLGVSLSEIENILRQMQRFDPSGICAPNLKMCLWVQLEDRGLLNPAYEVLLNHLDLVAQGDVTMLARKCQVTSDHLRQMLHEIRRLTPKPGLVFQNDVPSLMIPEVLMHWDLEQKTWAITLNPDTIPKVLLNKSYYAYVRTHITDLPEKRYVASQMAHANWLIKALHQRSVTLLRVATEIVRQQQEFFNLGIHALKPLILKDVAQTLDLHESTISRVTNHKYMATPRGTFELKYFFNSGLDNAKGTTTSSEAVRHRIQTLIMEESEKKPLSDGAIATLLQEEGIDIARRTVAKYREILNISPAFQRRRWKNLGVTR